MLAPTLRASTFGIHALLYRQTLGLETWSVRPPMCDRMTPDPWMHFAAVLIVAVPFVLGHWWDDDCVNIRTCLCLRSILTKFVGMVFNSIG